MQLFRHRDEDPDIEDNALVRASRRFLPMTDEYVGGKMIARVDGRRVVTPLFLVLIAIGSSDLLFALDSIPAVFGVTDEAFIVFVANAFALLGLRALFFLVKGLLDRLVYLSTGLSVILAFIGVKLVLHWAHKDISESVPEIGTAVSLAVIVRGPGRHHGGQPAQDTQRPGHQGPRGQCPGPFVGDRGASSAPIAGGVPDHGELTLDILAVEDGPDLPGLLGRVPAEHLLELGAVGVAAERRELGAEPAAGDAHGPAVRQSRAHVAERGGELHGRLLNGS